MMSQVTRLAAAAALSALLISGAAAESLAQAQSGTAVQPTTPRLGGPLANVRVVQMSVAPISDQSHVCGMDNDLILDSFQQPLTQQGIVIQKAAHVWIQLQATTVRFEEDKCISYIEARAVQNARYFDRKSGAERSGRVLLWSDGGLFVTGISNHGVTTNIGWRDLARSFMRKWAQDQ